MPVNCVKNKCSLSTEFTIQMSRLYLWNQFAEWTYNGTRKYENSITTNNLPSVVVKIPLILSQFQTLQDLIMCATHGGHVHGGCRYDSCPSIHLSNVSWYDFYFLDVFPVFVFYVCIFIEIFNSKFFICIKSNKILVGEAGLHQNDGDIFLKDNMYFHYIGSLQNIEFEHYQWYTNVYDCGCGSSYL